MSIDGKRSFVVDENPESLNLSPESLDGTTVRVSLIVDDPDAVGQASSRGGLEDARG